MTSQSNLPTRLKAALDNNEDTVVGVHRPHWFLLAKGLCIAVAGAALLAFAVALYVGSQAPSRALTIPFGFIAGAMSIAMIGIGFRHIIVHQTAALAITNKRILVHHGLFNRHLQTYSLSAVEQVSPYEPLIGQVLGFGYLQVSGTGGSPLLPFPIPHPQEAGHQLSKVI